MVDVLVEVSVSVIVIVMVTIAGYTSKDQSHDSDRNNNIRIWFLSNLPVCKIVLYLVPLLEILTRNSVLCCFGGFLFASIVCSMKHSILSTVYKKAKIVLVF